MGDPYVDAPLSRHEGSLEFRLVELHPSELSDPIRCTLRSYSFDLNPALYTALSYTWGPKVKPKNIELNGVCFPVGHSLWSFLEQMRLQQRFSFYWIDAICIDQESVLERNHQVQLMRHIYRNAACVSVWLGEADQDLTSDIAMAFLRTRSLPPNMHNWQPISVPTSQDLAVDLLGKERKKRWTPRFKRGTIPWSKQQAEAVLKLCERTYWSRIWIVQEIFLAREITMYCGSERVSWETLESLTYNLRQGQNFFDDFQMVRVANAISTSKASKLAYERITYRSNYGYPTLTELLVSFDDQHATNILDKVYGVCGLERDVTGFPIDYNTHPEDLLTRLLHYTWARMPQRKTLVLRDFTIVMSTALGVKWSLSKVDGQVALVTVRESIGNMEESIGTYHH